ncbi:MAG: complex I NDUFA9 subunit family protein [Nitrospinae bacterium]|nr:complex I NDUFA9 subunit family protein [Nitrospinota bacterium]
MKVLVAGGSGFIGSYLIDALTARGHRVTCLSRSTTRRTSSAENWRGDALEPASMAGALERHDAVINLIGIIRAFPSRGITFPRFHVEATRNLLDATRKAGVKRFIQMSANGASPDGIAEYQTTKAQGEELVRVSGLDWTIFRPSVVFGKPPEGKIEFCTQLGRSFKFAPVIPVFGDGNYRLQPIHAKDVAAAFAGALDNPASIGKTFHLGGDVAYSYREILNLIFIGMGKTPRAKLPVPWFLAKPVFSLLGSFAFFPATADEIEMLMAGNRVPETEYIKFFDIAPTPFNAENLAYLKETV